MRRLTLRGTTTTQGARRVRRYLARAGLPVRGRGGRGRRAV